MLPPPCISRGRSNRRFAVRCNGAAGYARGGRAAANRAGELVYACREQAAALFGVGEPERSHFHAERHACAEYCDKCARKTGFPRHCERLRAQCGHSAADGSKYRADRAGYAAVGRRGYGFCAETGAGTRCRPDDTLSHVSNVFGSIAPLDEIAELLTAAGVPLILRWRRSRRRGRD